MCCLKRFLVWLSRINHCRGFGIQSPTDYWMVRYVINEHWPYYAYERLGKGDDWLTSKLGRLYFRLANWRHPSTVLRDRYAAYWQAGCQRVQLADDVQRVELVRLEADDVQRYEQLAARCDDQSVVVVEGIGRNDVLWRKVVADSRATVTYDLYYCGIALYDSKRIKQHYKVNF